MVTRLITLMMTQVQHLDRCAFNEVQNLAIFSSLKKNKKIEKENYNKYLYVNSLFDKYFLAKYFAKVRKQKQNKEKIEKKWLWQRKKIDQGGDEYVERGLCRAYGIGCLLFFLLPSNP